MGLGVSEKLSTTLARQRETRRMVAGLEARFDALYRRVAVLSRDYARTHHLIYARTHRRLGSEKRAMAKLRVLEQRGHSITKMVALLSRLKLSLGRGRRLLTLPPEKLARLNYLLSK